MVRHRELEDQSVRYWRDDGVQLNAVGIDIWSLGLQEGVVRALQVWRDSLE